MLAKRLNEQRKGLLTEQRPMPLLPPFKAGKLPHKDMLLFRDQVNELIQQYNQEAGNEKKLLILQDIQKRIKRIEDKYPSSHLAKSPGFLAAHATLFKEIKHQYETLGIKSLDTSKERSSPLSELIANMSPEKVDKLLAILLPGSQAKIVGEDSELANLYSLDDDSEEAKRFRVFLKNHQIQYLGGSNSKNFKVTNIINNEEVVLKVDCRLDMPKDVESHLRDRLGDQIAPNDAERQAQCVVKGKRIVRTIAVVEYCTNGSLEDYRSKMEYMQDLEDSVGEIFEQMASTFLDIEEAGCMFPDAKFTNWLVDDNNRIFIADTKSFVYIDKKGRYDSGLPENKYYELTYSDGFSPPELGGFFSLSADAAHAYTLGKNLYSFITYKFEEGYNGKKFDFTHDFFKKNPEYRELIEGLVQSNPAKRMTVREALDRLFMLNNPDFKDVLTDLKALKYGENDKVMNQYIREKQQQINKTKDPDDPDERTRILKEMELMVQNLKADTVAREVRKIIKDFREGAGFFTIGMKAKANRIEQQMRELPLEERCNLIESKSLTKVEQAIASHRHWGGKTYLTSEGNIDLNKAANSFNGFKKFKDTLQKHKTTEESIQKENKEEIQNKF